MRGPGLALLLLMSLSAGGCAFNQGTAPADPFGLVTHTVDEKVPDGVQQAHIYEIDGEDVTTDRRTFRMAPGEHEVRVWPAGHQKQFIPDRLAIEEGRVRVDSVVLEVEAGYRYFLGVEETRTRGIVTVVTPEDTEIEYGEWEVTYQPVVVKKVPPADLERAAKGFGVFAGALLAAPLLGPAAFGG